MSSRGMDPLTVDLENRSFAQSEFRNPVVVVAGAGTGKTALLVARVAAWCVGPGWDRHSDADSNQNAVARRVIERVVAITFTEAAAAEMARKIGLAFLELASGGEPVGWSPDRAAIPEDSEELAKRARCLSEESHRLTVSTIHAFCQRLLATYPLEAGLHPRFEVDADGRRVEALAEKVVESAMRRATSGPDRSHLQTLAAERRVPASSSCASRRVSRRASSTGIHSTTRLPPSSKTGCVRHCQASGPPSATVSMGSPGNGPFPPGIWPTNWKRRSTPGIRRRA